MTPYYKQDGVTIYHGDCRDAFDVNCDRVIWDPPYGFGPYPTAVDFGVASMMSNLKLTHRTMVVFGYPEILVRWCMDASLCPDEWVTWWPTNKVTARNKGLNQETEHIAIFGEIVGADRLTRPRSKDGARQQRSIGARVAKHELAKWGDVWRMQSPGCGFNHAERLHPNEKPEELLRALIQLCSNQGEIVLDPCMGSGTTLVAAKRLGRKAIGIEREEKYCEIAAKRLAQGALPMEFTA